MKKHWSCMRLVYATQSRRNTWLPKASETSSLRKWLRIRKRPSEILARNISNKPSRSKKAWAISSVWSDFFYPSSRENDYEPLAKTTHFLGSAIHHTLRDGHACLRGRWWSPDFVPWLAAWSVSYTHLTLPTKRIV